MAAPATKIIKEKRRNLFILDLTALVARFRNLSLFGCKAAGGKVLLFYRDERRVGKKLGPDEDGRTGTGGGCWASRDVDLSDYFYVRLSRTVGPPASFSGTAHTQRPLELRVTAWIIIRFT